MALISIIECISRALNVAASGLLWDSFSFVRFPASICPSQPLVCFCFSIVASLGQFLVLSGTRLLWFPLHPLSDFAFLSWRLRDCFGFLSVPASLGPSPLMCDFVLYCPVFSGTVFSGFWLIRVSSPLFSRCIVWVIVIYCLTAWQ